MKLRSKLKASSKRNRMYTSTSPKTSCLRLKIIRRLNLDKKSFPTPSQPLLRLEPTRNSKRKGNPSFHRENPRTKIHIIYYFQFFAGVVNLKINLKISRNESNWRVGPGSILNLYIFRDTKLISEIKYLLYILYQVEREILKRTYLDSARSNSDHGPLWFPVVSYCFHNFALHNDCRLQMRWWFPFSAFLFLVLFSTIL